MKNKISITLDENVVEGIKTIIDGIYIRNTSQAVEYLLKKTLSGNNKAIFLCGGGSFKRTENGYFRPCTPFMDSTAIAHNLRFLNLNGFNEIVIVAQEPNLNEIKIAVEKEKIVGMNVKYIANAEDTQGSMDTLRMSGLLTGTTLVCFGDILFFDSNLQNFWKTHLLYKGISTLYVQAFTNKLGNAGVVNMEGNQINSFVQKPGTQFSLIHFSAVFITEPSILDYKGHSLEFDIFPQLAKKKQLIGYLSNKPIHHFHTEKEIKKLETQLKKPLQSESSSNSLKRKKVKQK
ncbi:MAG: sugar phosphate nucleotidyltransferase [archaeon]|jgi:NDP-sugar pyrophosphorylase family protein